MLTSDQINALRPKLFSIQLVAVALIIGVVLFAIIVAVITDWNSLNDRFKMLSLISTASGMLVLGLSMMVPRVFAAGENMPQQSDSVADPQQSINAILASMTVETLIRFALIEAAILLNLMVLMIEPHRAPIVIAGIGLLMMLVWFPRQSSMISTIEDRVRFPRDHSNTR